MLKAIQAPIRRVFEWLAQLFDKPFGPPWNPIRQLGTLAFFFFWISAVSGIYVFIVFDTSVTGAYASVEAMTAQWYLGGVMRSLHRYASDAMVACMVLHVLGEFSRDRYRGTRWFAWITGVIVVWLLFLSGISGYWLVWDELAQYVAIGSMEWIDWLGIFGEPVAENFLTRGSLDARFFSLLVFIHIFGPLFLLFAMWIHVLRVNQSRINPPRGLALGSLAMMVGLAFAYPAVSHPPADLGRVPQVLDLDWFFMALYPFFDRFGPGAMWGLAFGGSLLLCVTPWLPPLRQPKAPEVSLELCNGCTRCFEDCPYSAITMRPRSDGRPFEKEAVVDPDMCTRCGICVGACPMSTPFRHGETLVTAIDLPDFSLDTAHGLINGAIAKARAKGGAEAPSLLVVGCDHGAPVAAAIDADETGATRAVSLPCIGMLPPAFIDYALSGDGVDGVMLTGCDNCDCYHRFGIPWTEQRMAGLRDPYLRKRVPRERLHAVWAGPLGAARLATAVRAFRERLAGLPRADEETRSTPPEAA